MTRKFESTDGSTQLLTVYDDGRAVWGDGTPSMATIGDCEGWVKNGSSIEVFDVAPVEPLKDLLVREAKKRVVKNPNTNRDSWIERAYKAEIKVHELEADNKKQAIELDRLYAQVNSLRESKWTRFKAWCNRGTETTGVR